MAVESYAFEYCKVELGYRKVYLFAVETLVENDTERPNVDFGGDFWWRFSNDKTLWRQVPIGSGTLRSQIHAMVWIIVFGIHDFGQPKVGDFDVATHRASSQQNVS